jgi:hypothetical protein
MTISEADALRPSCSAELEPMYLQKMWNMTCDVSLTIKERTALSKKYYAQYTKWKTFQARLVIAIANLGASEFWDSMCEAFYEHGLCGDVGSPATTVEKVICLCLGSLEDNATVYQLSLLILLLERLGIRHEKCFVFDPCHSSDEVDVLKHLGFAILHENDEARIRVHEMTLFYMPHGDYCLTNNLISANYDALHLVSILGNNLAWVCNPDGKHTAAEEKVNLTTSRAPAVQKVLSIVKETHLQDTLSSKVRLQLASLAPKLSTAFANSLCDSLDCALSTFPSGTPWGDDIKKPSEPAYIGSSL